MRQRASARLPGRIRAWGLAAVFVLAAFASVKATPTLIDSAFFEAMRTNVLWNSDFETNTWMGASGYSYNSYPIGWYKTGSGSIIMSWAGGNAFAGKSPSGQKYLVTLQLNGTAATITLAHDFATEVSGFYTFSCFYTCRASGAHHAVQVYVDDILIDAFNTADTAWIPRTVQTPAIPAGQHTLRIYHTNPPGGDRSVS
jgi:hypothetical protein